MVRPQHPLAGVHGIALADLLPYPWLTPSRNHSAWLRICEAFTREGLAPPTDVIRTESALLTVGLLTSDDCICVLGREMMTHELARGELVALDLASSFWGERPTYMAYRTKGPLTPAAKAFIPVLRDVCHSVYGLPPRSA
jgi:DNA-binding transcriptional LysR family regulator